MKETDRKEIRQVEWLRQHTLSPEQLKQLFQNKVDRAVKMSQALKERESKTVAC